MGVLGKYSQTILFEWPAWNWAGCWLLVEFPQGPFAQNYGGQFWVYKEQKGLVMRAQVWCSRKLMMKCNAAYIMHPNCNVTNAGGISFKNKKWRKEDWKSTSETHKMWILWCVKVHWTTWLTLEPSGIQIFRCIFAWNFFPVVLCIIFNFITQYCM